MKPFDYQEEGISFLISNERCLLADSMGLGKTLQAIIACQRLNLKNILVICPAALRLNWINEIKKWWHEGLDNFEIVSYNFCQVNEKVETLTNKSYDVLLCDEAHALKSWKSTQTQNIIMKVSKVCKRIWLMTGTPATKSAADYHPILSVLEPGKHGKFKVFCEEFCYKKKGFGFPGAIQYYGFKNNEKLKDMVGAISLRRLKKDVLKELPSKIYSRITVDIESEKVTPEDCELVRLAFERGNADMAIATKLREIGMKKVRSALNFIQSIEEPLIVFCWHVDVIKQLINSCNKDCAAIYGAIDASKKQKIVESFQAGDLEVLFVNIAAGGVGITLTKSNHILFVEPCWSPAMMLQAEDRAHRIGQAAECVNIYHMVAENTVDEAVFDCLDMKRRGIESVMAADI